MTDIRTNTTNTPLQNVNAQQKSGETTPYTIKYGDTLSAIARTHKVSIDNILDVNPHITNPDLIFEGAILNIPKSPTINATNTPTQANESVSPTQATDVVEEPTLPNANLNPQNTTGPELQEPVAPTALETPAEVEIDPNKDKSTTDEIVGFLDKFMNDPDLQLYTGVGIAITALAIPVVGQIVSGLAAITMFLGVFSDIKNEMAKENPSIGNVLKKSWSKLAMGALFTAGALMPGIGALGGLFMLTRGAGMQGQNLGAAGAAAGGPNIPMPIPEDDQQNSSEEVLETTSQPQGPRLDFRQYEIQAGDTLSQIAQNNQCTIPEILALNPEKIKDPDKINADDIIKLPLTTPATQNDEINNQS